MNDTEPAVLEQRFDQTSVVTLNRADTMNAMNGALVQSLHDIFSRLADDDDVRSVILTGAGDRAFCVGADLKERRGMSEADVAQRLIDYRTTFEKIERCPKPTICAINGYAFGGGLELALGCDFRIAKAETKVGLTETHLGIIPGAGGTQRLARLVGPTVAKELIFSARRMTAKEAHELSIVTRISEGDLLEDALSYAQTFHAAAPIAIAQAKRAIDFGIEKPLAEALVWESECYAVTLGTEDRLEGLAAFKEKRKPVWKGR